MMFQNKVDEVDGTLPLKVETVHIETDSATAPEESEKEQGTNAEEEGGTTVINTEDDEDDDKLLDATRETQWVNATTRAGQISRLPTRYRQEINDAALNILVGWNYYELIIEEDEYDDKNELACMGAGLGGRFDNTTELHPMNYKTAMKTPDKEKWKRAVEEEHDRMVKMNVWEGIQITDIPSNVKLITSTWAVKKKLPLIGFSFPDAVQKS